MRRTFGLHTSRFWLCGLSLVVLLLALSACGSSTPPPKPAVWTNYQGEAFIMNYFSSWGVGTKDLYLGTSYPALEMLQGMSFISPDSPETFVQVSYAQNTNGKASVSDLLSQHILGTVQKPLATASLTRTTLAGVSWTQGVVQKQVTHSDGTVETVAETALGVEHISSTGVKEIYLLVYQNQTGSAAKSAESYLTRMINSFSFAS